MFKTEESSSKDSFLEQAKAAREERAQGKLRENNIIRIQALVRGWLTRVKITRSVLEEFDENFPEVSTLGDDGTPKLKPALDVYKVISRFLHFYKKNRDQGRIEQLCRYLIHTLDSKSPKLSYIGVALIKDNHISWISQIKTILYHCLTGLDALRPERQLDYKCILLRLNTLIRFTSPATWAILKVEEMKTLRPGMNQLCANIMGHLVANGFYPIMKVLLIKGLGRSPIALTPDALSAAVELTIRPLVSSHMSDKLVSLFLINVFSVPGLVHHLNASDTSRECISSFLTHNFFARSLELLNSEQNLRIVFNTLEGSYALCLLANIIHLAKIEKDEVLKDLYYPSFTFVVTKMLEACQQYVVAKQSNSTYWHPVLGCFAQTIDTSLQQSIKCVTSQLTFLWTGRIVAQLLGHPLKELVEKEIPSPPEQQSTSVGTNIFRRAFLEARTNRNNSSKNYRKLGSPETTRIALTSSLYQTALHTLTQLKLEILTGLCYQDKILYHMWLFLGTLGPHCGLKAFLDHLAANTKCTAPEFQMLILFCDCMTHYVTILDDIEMYEQQDPFKLADFVTMSYFLNQFLYKAVLNNLFGDVKSASTNPLFTSFHTLLMVLYRRDCRRTFCPDGHWLAKEVRVSGFLADLEKGRRGAELLLQKMPHVIPHSERVVLFRKHVANEKAVMGLTESACNSPPTTLIAVHRSRIVEDGYRQLAMLPPQALKGVIRVRFVNEQGLDEAGIDQDGVFKEFLEETIKRVFDPSLNLFKTTSENRLYPSPTSSMQDNHLQLFEFVGRMLGKAVYEGIVVDVPFASFFVSQFSGQAGGALYSWLDELASLDRDLYRSLTLVKHYKGDVRQLELTFSLNEDLMGELVTHELTPGGRASPVTDENKIQYIHLMAHFRMHYQIKDQTAAFIKGFRSIINPEWLALFSTPELQRLISGDNVPLDLRDLRKHTQYYGGFHDSHRVVCWLWDILEKDFSEEERGLFLKFVTSCSKSPLLGFAHLEPPFSIRCVEVGDDEDTGDTIGSVIRGFFTIRKKDPQNRLPTSSTCFNLLKLPNYQKKSTLREKLRYAVTSNTGFELS